MNEEHIFRLNRSIWLISPGLVVVCWLALGVKRGICVHTLCVGPGVDERCLNHLQARCFPFLPASPRQSTAM